MSNLSYAKNLISKATRVSLVVRVAWVKGLDCLSLRFEPGQVHNNNGVVVELKGHMKCILTKKKKKKKKIYIYIYI